MVDIQPDRPGALAVRCQNRSGRYVGQMFEAVGPDVGRLDGPVIVPVMVFEPQAEVW